MEGLDGLGGLEEMDGYKGLDELGGLTGLGDSKDVMGWNEWMDWKDWVDRVDWVKVSYSWMPYIGSIINNYNKKILTNNNIPLQNGCNCRKKRPMPARQQLPHHKRNLLS